jgi:hypothetical protein
VCFMGWRRKQQDQKRLKKLSKKTNQTYFDEDKKRYVRCYQPRLIGFFANQYNRRVRYFKGEIPDGNYAKYFKQNAQWNYW